MVICSLDASKKSSKNKETRIKKEIGEVLPGIWKGEGWESRQVYRF